MAARKNGFTLIEIMIVIAIIGLLSVILVPKVGAIRMQSKNKGVFTNVLLVRSYLDNRSGKDADLYISSADDEKTPAEALQSILKNMDQDMTTNFSGSSALGNPFNGSRNIDEIGTTSNSSVLLYYSSDTLPEDNNIGNDAAFPKGADISGSTVVVVYGRGVQAVEGERYVTDGGYVLYGVDDSGNIVSPYIIKFPSVPISNSSSSDNDPDNGNDDGDTETTADMFQANCLNIFGDSVTNDIDLGNSGAGTMNINGSAYLQGTQINLVQNTNIMGNLDIVGTGDGSNVTIGNSSNNTLEVNGTTNIQAKDVSIKSNFDMYNSMYILADNDVTFENAGINTNFNGGNAFIKSGRNINFNNNINVVDTRFSAVTDGNINFNSVGKSLNLDDGSSAYIKSGQDITFDYSIDTNAPVTMISGKDIIFNNNGKKVDIRGNTYIHAEGSLKTLRNVSRAKPVEQPTYPAVEPTPINKLDTNKYQIKAVKSGITYNTKDNPYNNTDPSLAVSILKNPDTDTLREVLNSQNIASDKYKLLIIDGNIDISKKTINDYSNSNITLNKFMIYCTGKINFPTDSNFNNVIFNNSSIIAKSMDTKLQSTFSMTQLDSNQYNDTIKNKVNQYINEYLN